MQHIHHMVICACNCCRDGSTLELQPVLVSTLGTAQEGQRLRDWKNNIPHDFCQTILASLQGGKQKHLRLPFPQTPHIHLHTYTLAYTTTNLKMSIVEKKLLRKQRQNLMSNLSPWKNQTLKKSYSFLSYSPFSLYLEQINPFILI